MWQGVDVFSLVLIVAIGVFLLGSFAGYTVRGIGSSFSYRPPQDWAKLPEARGRALDRGPYRPSRFRFLVAICLGVAGTLAWQSYGDATKKLATRASELGWSPESKQIIAGSIQWLGWTKQPSGPEITATETVAPKAP